MRALLIALFSLVFMTAALADDAPLWPAPTRDDIHDAVMREEATNYLDDYAKKIYHYTGISVEVGEPKIGKFTYEVLDYSAERKACWTVRVVATLTATRENSPDETKVIGDQPGQTWYFYKNTYDEWADCDRQPVRGGCRAPVTRAVTGPAGYSWPIL